VIVLHLSKSLEVRHALPPGDLARDGQPQEKQRVCAAKYGELDTHRLSQQDWHEVTESPEAKQ
jgi:hypothetical protein